MDLLNLLPSPLANLCQRGKRRKHIIDLLKVIYSSLLVHPWLFNLAASMPLVAKRNGAKLVIINRDPTPYDHMADIVIHGQAGPTMSNILEKVREELGMK